MLTGAISPALPDARVSVQRQTLAGRWVPVVRGGVEALGGNRVRYRVTVPKIRRPCMIRVAVMPMDNGRPHARLQPRAADARARLDGVRRIDRR